MTQARRISARGTWPGPIALRSSWWKAVCRRLNDDCDDAALRIERGSVDFTDRCAGWILDSGVPAVWSPPLTSTASSMWKSAGFEAAQELVMFERSLTRAIGARHHEVRPGTDDDWEGAARIDGLAFEGPWRMGMIGLRDAMTATPTSVLLVADDGDRQVGFAIIGLAMSSSYLQRIAVDPSAQGRGIGRALLRASMSWALGSGARTMLLNTQPDNHGAAELYRSEGFASLPDRLRLYRRLPEANP